MRPSEWVSLVFFVYLAIAAAARPLPLDRRLSAGIGSLLMAALVSAVSRLDGWAGRDWAPAVYVLAGYYLAARTFVRPQPQVESWLIAWDRRLLGDPASWFGAWPRPLVALLETAYIGCFLLVPLGYGLLAMAGHGHLADRYWTIVAGAELGSFAALPYLQTRPPWVIERLAESGGMAGRRASVAFMQRATTWANTLPSGHAAGSLAVALAVIDALPLAGTVLLVLAVLVACATIVTRAHYLVDVVTGAALAIGIWLIVR